MNTLPESGSGRDTIDPELLKLSGAMRAIRIAPPPLNVGQAVFRFLDHYFDNLDRRFVSYQIAEGPVALQIIAQLLPLVHR